jgi:hypothetical protein
MSVYLPVWQQPHTFTALVAKRPRGRLTCLLASVELVRWSNEVEIGQETGLGEITARLGHEWLVTIANRLHEEVGLAPCPLGIVLRERRGIQEPGQPALRLGTNTGFEDPHGLMHAIDVFAAAELPAIRAWAVADLGVLVSELERAADARELPDPTRVCIHEGEGLEHARRLLAAYEPRLQPEPLKRRRDDRRVWGWRFASLDQRVALELFELFALRPRLDRCYLCGRVFVPRGRKRSCRAHLWAQGQHGEALEYCTGERVGERAARSEEDIEYDRLQKQASRMRKHPWGDPRRQRAEQELAAWREANPRKKRGPPPRPEPPDIVRED